MAALLGACAAMSACGDEDQQPAPAIEGNGGPAAPGPLAPDSGAAARPSVEAPTLDAPANTDLAPTDELAGETLATPAGITEGQSCAASVLQAETIERVIEIPIEETVVVPSVFYLMLDSSGSMVSDPFTLAGLVEDILDLFGLGQRPPQPTKWDYAVAGLKDFIRDPSSAGIEMGLGYFPDSGLCDGSGYDIPFVGLAPLPDNAAALEFSLDSRAPNGGTPLEGALRGATNFCLAFNAQNPDASCVAVLITDGAAEDCSARSAAALASIAADAAARGVITYAAGMQGADYAVLDAIGRAGGGDCDPSSTSFACDLTSDRDAFVAALSSIRDRTRTQTRIETRIETEVQRLPCEWEIPAPPEGESLDPARVNVELAPLAGEGAVIALANVASAAACADADGWHYDDPAAPSTVVACPATCQRIEGAQNVRVNLLFGCATTLR